MTRTLFTSFKISDNNYSYYKNILLKVNKYFPICDIKNIIYSFSYRTNGIFYAHDFYHVGTMNSFFKYDNNTFEPLDIFNQSVLLVH